MDEYINSLEKEFIESNGSSENFIEWLQIKKNHLESYYYLLEYMGLDLKEQVIELSKGKYDNLGLVIPSNKMIIEISPYAKTICDSNAICISGKLVANVKPIIISNSNEKISFDLHNNATYLAELPFDLSDKIAIEALAAFDKKIFVGTYGSNRELDKDKKINQLHNLRKIIETYHNKIIIEEENVTVYDTYINVLKIRPKRYDRI